MNQLDVLALPRDPLPPLHPVLLRGGGETVLVDCGCTGFLPLVQAAMKVVGADLAQLTRVFITHHDHDHMGALAALKRACPGAQVLASAEQQPYIEGRLKSLRLAQAEALFPSLPEDRKPEALRFQQVVGAVEPVRVDATGADGEAFPWCGGIEVVATPGHMPGHISLYARESRTLIAGDALVAANGRLGTANPQYSLDMPQALASMRKLLDYDLARVVCYHGGVVEGDIRQAVLDALAQ
jgi:glyoxylase-like metal-dependent hydrolase (beta-lactamase superfamily II)